MQGKLTETYRQVPPLRYQVQYTYSRASTRDEHYDHAYTIAVLQDQDLIATSREGSVTNRSSNKTESFKSKTFRRPDMVGMSRRPDLAYVMDVDATSLARHASSNLLSRPDRHSNMLRYGFGDGRLHLKDWKIVDPTIDRWEVSRIDTGSGDPSAAKYLVSRFRTHRLGGHPDIELTIDPQKNYMISKIRLLEADGEVFRSQEIALEKVSDDLWLPAQVIERDYREGNANDIVSEEKIVISDIVMNTPVRKSDFTIKALQLDEGATIIKRSPNGGEERMVYAFGNAMPEEVIGVLNEDELVDARLGAMGNNPVAQPDAIQTPANGATLNEGIGLSERAVVVEAGSPHLQNRFVVAVIISVILLLIVVAAWAARVIIRRLST